MNVLLDTHFVIWTAMDPGRLTSKEKALLEQDDVTIFCSTVSLWELRLKWHSFDKDGARKGAADPEIVLKYAEGVGWSLLELRPRHSVSRLKERTPHSDPFDELLLVQAQVEGLRLLTRDLKLIDHPLALTA